MPGQFQPRMSFTATLNLGEANPVVYKQSAV
jgi:hypothetical protein